MNKKAYPIEPWRNITPAYSIDKFLSSFQEVLDLQKTTNRDKAVAEVTNDWKTTERDDFINWMKFYEGSNHLKYKKAFMLDNGVYVPGEPAKPVTSQVTTVAPEKPVELPPEDPNKINLSVHKKKIISRLDSLEKLLRNDISQQFTGIEFTDLIRSIHDLKSKFYSLKIANQTVDDMIIRASNQLISRGHLNAGTMLIKHAQVAPATVPPATTTENIDNVTPANNQQTGPMSSLDGPGSAVLDLSAVPPAEDEEDSPENEFLENMNGGLYTDVDNQESSDNKDVLLSFDDESEEYDIETIASDPDTLITIFAQEEPISPSLPLPNEGLANPTSQPAVDQKPVETTTTTTTQEDSALDISTDIDDLLEKALGDVTPEMVINKLEEISKIFKTKEIPRQLALVDLMLDKLGFASFFPALSEASGKAIESSNYIASRIDNVLSSLRGVMQTDGIDLVNGEGSTDPKLQAIQAKLQQQQDKEEARKLSQREQKETPVIDIDQPPPATIVPPTTITPQTTPVAAPVTPAPTTSPTAV